MVEARGRGLGKVILCGEHAVVYGHPALAVALDRGTTVALSRRPSGRHVEAAFRDDRLDQALDAVVGDGWDVRIDSDLPVGRGLGSSAALAVALVRAHAAATGARLDPAALHARSLEVERVFHGTPSGIDNAVAARGGVVRFRRGAAGPIIEPLPAPTWTLVVLDSGSAGNTAELVAGVRARRPAIDGDLARIGALVTEAAAVLDDPAALGPLLRDNHDRLRAIGVSTPRLDALVDLAMDAGALGAKLAGAGGGGVVIALVASDPSAVLAAAGDADIPAFACRPGGTA